MKASIQESVLTEILSPKFSRCLFHLTNRCQLKCKHCYINSSPKGEFGLPLELSYEVANELYSRFGTLCFAISGGEALMRREDTIKLLSYSSKIHRPLLLTNGIAIDKEIAKQITQYHASVQVSLDGGKAKTHDYLRGNGAFKRCCNGLKILNNQGVRGDNLILSSTIYGGDVRKNLKEILAIAEKYDVGRVKVETLVRIGRALFNYSNGDDHEHALSDKLKCAIGELDNFISSKGWRIKLRKSALLRSLCVYSDGSAFPFTSFFEGKIIENNVGYLGNIYSRDWDSIFNINKLSNISLVTFCHHIRSGERRNLSYIFERD